jgi:hypothetical protein
MDYMITLYSDENAPMPEPGTPEFGEMMGQWMGYNQTLIDGGHWIAASNLMPTVTATTIRQSFGNPPQIADLDQALELAKGIPLPQGSVEVRPVAFRPDAPENQG